MACNNYRIGEIKECSDLVHAERYVKELKVARFLDDKTPEEKPLVITEEPEEQLKEFIFDEEKIIQKKVFSSCWFNQNVFCFGLLLPKVLDIYDKKGNIIGKTQGWRPVLITSTHQGIEVSKFTENFHKINFGETPVEMKLRWSLRDIKYYLDNKPTVDGFELFNKIKEQYEYYVYFREKKWYSVHALWDIGTYLHQCFTAFPIFEMRGLSGTGKSKVMVVSSFITLNATDILINPSEATLFRMTEEMRPAKYIDEAEKLFTFGKNGIEADNRVELINASYTRNGVVARQESIGKKYITKNYHVYSPTMISSINGLYGATENRAITQIMTKSHDDDERGEREPEADFQDKKWSEMRNSCYIWALNNCKQIQEEYDNFKIATKLKKRDLQLWKSLLVLAKLLEPEKLLPEMIEFAERLSEQRKNDSLSESSLDYKYLLCFKNAIMRSPNYRVYLDFIKNEFRLMYSAEAETKSNKSISTHLDKLGFRELRNKDRVGSYYEIDRNIFNEIVTQISKDLIISENEEKSPQSSQSSQNRENIKKYCDEQVTNVMNNNDNNDNNNNNNKNKCDECCENDESDNYLDTPQIIQDNVIHIKNDVETVKPQIESSWTKQIEQHENKLAKLFNLKKKPSEINFEDTGIKEKLESGGEEHG